MDDQNLKNMINDQLQKLDENSKYKNEQKIVILQNEKIQKKKVQSLFDIDKETLEYIKEEFPENQHQPKILKQKSNSKLKQTILDMVNTKQSITKQGLKIKDFLQMLQKYIDLDKKECQKIHQSLDHFQPEVITWKEFLLWLQEQGNARDLVHNAQMYQVGLTRLEEGQILKMSNNRVEPKIELLIPITLKKNSEDSLQQDDINLLFLVLDNKVAKFFDQQSMKCIHRLQFDTTINIKINTKKYLPLSRNKQLNNNDSINSPQRSPQNDRKGTEMSISEADEFDYMIKKSNHQNFQKSTSRPIRNDDQTNNYQMQNSVMTSDYQSKGFKMHNQSHLQKIDEDGNLELELTTPQSSKGKQFSKFRSQTRQEARSGSPVIENNDNVKKKKLEIEKKSNMIQSMKRTPFLSNRIQVNQIQQNETGDNQLRLSDYQQQVSKRIDKQKKYASTYHNRSISIDNQSTMHNSVMKDQSQSYNLKQFNPQKFDQFKSNITAMNKTFRSKRSIFKDKPGVPSSIDYSYEILGINRLGDFDFSQNNLDTSKHFESQIENQSQMKQNKNLENPLIVDPNKTGIDKFQFKERTTKLRKDSIVERHQGIIETAFTPNSIKRIDTSLYNQIIKNIDEKIKSNNRDLKNLNKSGNKKGQKGNNFQLNQGMVPISPMSNTESSTHQEIHSSQHSFQIMNQDNSKNNNRKPSSQNPLIAKSNVRNFNLSNDGESVQFENQGQKSLKISGQSKNKNNDLSQIKVYDINKIRSRDQQRNIEKIQESFFDDKNHRWHKQIDYEQMFKDREIRRMLESPVPRPPVFNSENGFKTNDYTKEGLERMLNYIHGKNSNEVEKAQISTQKYINEEFEDREQIIRDFNEDDPMGIKSEKKTLADCFRNKKVLTFHRQNLNFKIKQGQRRLSMIEQVINRKQNDFFNENKPIIFDQIIKDKKTNKENSESEDEKNNESEGIKELFIKPKMKLQYAPGGSTGREEYLPKLPKITACCYLEARKLLIICFIDRLCKIFRIRGMSKGKLDVEYIEKGFTTDFICTNVHSGIHQQTEQYVAFLAGQSKFQITVIDPDSHRFLENLHYLSLPIVNRQTLLQQKTGEIMRDKTNLVTSIAFDDNHGILISFFTGYFKMFDPIEFKMVWQQSTDDLKDINKSQENVVLANKDEKKQVKNATFIIKQKLNDEFSMPDRNIKQIKQQMKIAGTSKLSNIKQMGEDQQVIDTHMSIVCSNLSKKLAYYVIGGVDGRLMLFDIISKTLISQNDDVHSSEILNLFFYDQQSQIISCSKDRQLSLWDANKFECMQSIKDFNYELNHFNLFSFNQYTQQIFGCVSKIKVYELKLNQKVEIQQTQIQALVDQNKDIMSEQIFQQSKENLHTVEGKLIHDQIELERRLNSKIASSLRQKLVISSNNQQKQQKQQIQSNKVNKPSDYGKVLMNNRSQLIYIDTNLDENYDIQGKQNLQIFTIDSDFMMRIWDLSYGNSIQNQKGTAIQLKKSQDLHKKNQNLLQNLISQSECTQNDDFRGKYIEKGACKDSIIIKPCDNAEKLISKLDEFKNEVARGSEQFGAIKRKIHCAIIYQFNTDKDRSEDWIMPSMARKKVIAFADQAGILQVNNFHSGNLLMSLTNTKNKKEITHIHYINKGKIYLVAACLDRSIMFILKPNLTAKNDQHSSEQIQTIFKKGIHNGDITGIRSNSEFISIGSQDNTVSIWKIIGLNLNCQIQLPGSSPSSFKLKNHLIPDQVYVSDLQFIGLEKDDEKSAYTNENKNQVLTSTHAKTQLLVLQTNGNIHLCNTNSKNVFQINLIMTNCINACMSISESTVNNFNGVLIVNENGSMAQTWIPNSGQFTIKKQNTFYEQINNIKDKKDFERQSSQGDDCQSEINEWEYEIMQLKNEIGNKEQFKYIQIYINMLDSIQQNYKISNNQYDIDKFKLMFNKSQENQNKKKDSNEIFEKSKELQNKLLVKAWLDYQITKRKQNQIKNSNSEAARIQQQIGFEKKKQFLKQAFFSLLNKNLQEDEFEYQLNFKTEQMMVKYFQKEDKNDTEDDKSKSKQKKLEFEKVCEWQPFVQSFEEVNQGFPDHSFNDKKKDKGNPDSEQIKFNSIVNAKILGSGLCMIAMAQGQVSLFEFWSGDIIFRLNTHQIQKFPRLQIQQALESNIREKLIDKLMK